MKLIACDGCRRHVKASERACVFCGAALTGSDASLEGAPLRVRAMAGVAIALVAAACGGPAVVAMYGAPPTPEPPEGGLATPPVTTDPTPPAADAGAGSGRDTPAPTATVIALYGAPPMGH